MPDNPNTNASIKEQLRTFSDNREKCGFEAYIVTKEEPVLHRIALHDAETEGEEGISFNKKIKNMLLDTFSEKYLSAEVEYALASDVADNQKKMYCIPQKDDGYCPFIFLSTDPVEFNETDLLNSTGLAFCFRKDTETLWLYQHLWAILVPNKKKVNLMSRITRMENGFVFHEQKEPLLTIAPKVDIAVFNGQIITENIGLMQKSFGFQDYIRITAERSVEQVKKNGIVSNADKLTEYIARGNGNTRYAKKLMRIADSAVLAMKPEQLINRIKTVERWKDVFVLNEAQNAIELKTYVHVEHLIDLLDERYMKSEITGTEYDTEVKKRASPIGQEN